MKKVNSAMETATECTNWQPLPSGEWNLTKTEGELNTSLRTANSPCPIGLFTLLDASIYRHFALSIKSWVYCLCLDRGSFQDITTLNVC